MTNVQKQCLLVFLGYDTGGVDGIWGPKSRMATAGFQEDYGLEPNGAFDPLTEAKILEIMAGKAPVEAPRDPQEAVTPHTVEMDRNTVMVFSLAEEGHIYLAKNFQVREFACKDGTDPVFVHPLLPLWCQAVRDKWGYAFAPNSAYRTVVHNAKPSTGGASRSPHCRGLAVDIPAQEGVNTPRELYDFFEELLGDGPYGLGIYSWGVHVDVRGAKYRFVG